MPLATRQDLTHKGRLIAGLIGVVVQVLASVLSYMIAPFIWRGDPMFAALKIMLAIVCVNGVCIWLMTTLMMRRLGVEKRLWHTGHSGTVSGGVVTLRSTWKSNYGTQAGRTFFLSYLLTALLAAALSFIPLGRYGRRIRDNPASLPETAMLTAYSGLTWPAWVARTFHAYDEGQADAKKFKMGDTLVAATTILIYRDLLNDNGDISPTFGARTALVDPGTSFCVVQPDVVVHGKNSVTAAYQKVMMVGKNGQREIVYTSTTNNHRDTSMSVVQGGTACSGG